MLMMTTWLQRAMLVLFLVFITLNVFSSSPTSTMTTTTPMMMMPPPGHLSNRTRTLPVRLKVCIESLCVDSRNFFLEQLFPTYTWFGPKFIRLETVIYGNAVLNQTTGAKINCQHGAAECDLNTYEQCAIDLYHAPSLYLPFLFCMYHSFPMQTTERLYPTGRVEKCAVENSLNFTRIATCHDDPKRAQALDQLAAEQTPPHNFIPWVEINGMHNPQAVQRSLAKQICREIIAAGGTHPVCATWEQTNHAGQLQ